MIKKQDDIETDRLIQRYRFFFLFLLFIFSSGEYQYNTSPVYLSYTGTSGIAKSDKASFESVYISPLVRQNVFSSELSKLNEQKEFTVQTEKEVHPEPEKRKRANDNESEPDHKISITYYLLIILGKIDVSDTNTLKTIIGSTKRLKKTPHFVFSGTDILFCEITHFPFVIGRNKSGISVDFDASTIKFYPEFNIDEEQFKDSLKRVSLIFFSFLLDFSSTCYCIKEW